jgi:hypothetical protein
MKITSQQLRKIIREEIEKVTESPKNDSRLGPAPKLAPRAYYGGSSDDIFGHGPGGPSPSGPNYEMVPKDYRSFFADLEEITPKQADEHMDKPLDAPGIRTMKTIVQWYEHPMFGGSPRPW